jgi:hypothetical protein
MQEGYSRPERAAALPAWRKGLGKIAVPIPINNKRAIFLFIPFCNWKDPLKTKIYSHLRQPSGYDERQTMSDEQKTNQKYLKFPHGYPPLTGRASLPAGRRGCGCPKGKEAQGGVIF